jgi:hypothetical protein|tara:strand:+ start:211 stop:960 length:750 start_codon:yes stop_codon:yes gene_type:complete
MIITLTTDFGDSEYVGAMKGVIYDICPKTTVVDISHGIRKFDIRHAAYVVLSTTSYFPKTTIHCVVVDPEVGTNRRGIIVKTDKYTYIGPDNGSFSFIRGIQKIIEIKQATRYPTFQGRDIFAPVSAKIACGHSIEDFGNEITSIKKLEMENTVVEGRTATGEVMCIDGFGNIITNIYAESLNLKIGEVVKIKVGEKKLKIRYLHSYAFGKKDELMIIEGSSGFIELAINKGSAKDTMKLKSGEKVVIG